MFKEYDKGLDSIMAFWLLVSVFVQFFVSGASLTIGVLGFTVAYVFLTDGKR